MCFNAAHEVMSCILVAEFSHCARDILKILDWSRHICSGRGRMGTRLGLLVMFLNHKLEGVIGKSQQNRPTERHPYVPPLASLLLGTFSTLLLLLIFAGAVFEDGSFSMKIIRIKTKSK